MIDLDLVYELMPTNVTAVWGKYGPLIMEARSSGTTTPHLFRLVECLANRLSEHARKRGDPVITQYRGYSSEVTD